MSDQYMTAQELIARMVGKGRWDPYNDEVRSAVEAAGFHVAWVKLEGTKMTFYCYDRATADRLTTWFHFNRVFPSVKADTRSDGPPADVGPHHYVDVALL